MEKKFFCYRCKKEVGTGREKIGDQIFCPGCRTTVMLLESCNCGYHCYGTPLMVHPSADAQMVPPEVGPRMWYRLSELIGRSVDRVISVGSVDGVCTSAAVIREFGNSELRMGGKPCEVEFCQAFTVDRIDPTKWGEKSFVMFVDLAVNNRDKAMTYDFLRRIDAAGHTILGVLDEHNAEDWREAFAVAKLSFCELAIKPVSQDKGDIQSSGALLLSIFGNKMDEHSRQLCEAADAADRMDFSTHFGGIVNQAVKSRIGDDSRRVYLAKHFAQNRDADETIRGWIAEYEAILATHKEIVEVREDLGNGITLINTVGKTVDMGTLISKIYEMGYSVIMTEGEMYDKAVGAKTRQIALSWKPVLLNIPAAIKTAKIECSVFANKANIRCEDKEVALTAVRTALM